MRENVPPQPPLPVPPRRSTPPPAAPRRWRGGVPRRRSHAAASPSARLRRACRQSALRKVWRLRDAVQARELSPLARHAGPRPRSSVSPRSDVRFRGITPPGSSAELRANPQAQGRSQVPVVSERQSPQRVDQCDHQEDTPTMICSARSATILRYAQSGRQRWRRPSVSRKPSAAAPMLRRRRCEMFVRRWPGDAPE